GAFAQQLNGPQEVLMTLASDHTQPRDFDLLVSIDYRLAPVRRQNIETASRFQCRGDRGFHQKPAKLLRSQGDVGVCAKLKLGCTCEPLADSLQKVSFISLSG